MQKHTRWLLAEIDRWEAEGLVSSEQAERLRHRYALPASSTPWGLIVFATAGAVVIGLGVILLFAYNWDDIPKYAKLALVFLALIAAHTAGVRLLSREGWQSKLGEALAALGTMFFGAGIWLVAQVYNIDEHYPNGFLFWAIGALAMAWAIRSIANGLLAVVLLTIWGCCESLDFRDPQYWSVVLIGAGLLPLAWRQRSTILLAAALAAIQLLVAVNVGIWGSSAHAFSASLALGVLLVAGSRLAATACPDFKPGASVLAFFGFSGFFVCAYLLSFHEAAKQLLNWRLTEGEQPVVAGIFGWSLFGAGLAAWLWLARRALVQKTIEIHLEEWLLPIALLYCFGLAAMGVEDLESFVSWSFNLVLLGLAVMWIWRGCQESQLRPTVLGSLLLSAVVLARYFDLFQSLASRGVAFIVLGVIFVLEAMYYRKIRQAAGGTG